MSVSSKAATRSLKGKPRRKLAPKGPKFERTPGQPGTQGPGLSAGDDRERGDPLLDVKRRHLQRRSDQDLGERARFGATRASPSLSFGRQRRQSAAANGSARMHRASRSAISKSGTAFAVRARSNVSESRLRTQLSHRPISELCQSHKGVIPETRAAESSGICFTAGAKEIPARRRSAAAAGMTMSDAMQIEYGP